jgi:hypothetical protein
MKNVNMIIPTEIANPAVKARIVKRIILLLCVGVVIARVVAAQILHLDFKKKKYK